MAPHIGMPVAAFHFRHALAGVTAPALHVSAARKSMPIKLHQLRFVQPRFRRAVEHVAVIEHETRLVRMAEVFEARDLQFAARMSIINVVDDVAAVAKINQVEMIFVAHGVDVGDQVLLLLHGTIFVTLAVNEPGNHPVGAKLRAQLFRAHARGMDEVRPPMIVRLRFVFLPFVQRRAAHDDDVFARAGPCVCAIALAQKNKGATEESFHHFSGSTIYAEGAMRASAGRFLNNRTK